MATQNTSKDKEQTKTLLIPTKTGNQKLFIGLIIGVLIGTIFALHGLELLPGGYKYAAAVMIGAFFMVAFLLLITVFFRDKIARAIFGEIGDLDSFRSDATALIGSTAVAVSDTITKPFPKEHRQRMRWIAPRLANYFIWGRVRSWWFNLLLTVFLAIGGLATTVLLVNQNKLLETQNRKFDIQNALAEGQRRSSLVLLMGNVLTDLSKEIDKQKEGVSRDSTLALDRIGYSLSTPLIGRISSLTQGFLPYRILINENLTEREYSPERAQLLLALVGSNLDTTTLLSIYQRTSFSQAYLIDAQLRNANLRNADLSGANLSGAKLIDADLRNADFIDAKLINANLSGALLSGADLRNANLSKAYLSGANLSGAKLINANLSGAKLSKTNLNQTNFRGANLSEANLSNVSLSNAILANVNLSGADLSDSNLSGTDFSEANFSEALITNSRLNNARNLHINQLFEARSLNYTGGIDKWTEELKKKRPCLFTNNACPFDWSKYRSRLKSNEVKGGY